MHFQVLVKKICTFLVVLLSKLCLTEWIEIFLNYECIDYLRLWL